MVRSRQSRIKNYFAENRLFTIRSIVAGVIAAVLLLAVAGRLYYLQVVKFDYYHGLSQGNSIRTEPIPPSRGLILDRHGVVLADNLPAFNIELVREQIGDNKALDATLAQLVSIGLLRSEEVSNTKKKWRGSPCIATNLRAWTFARGWRGITRCAKWAFMPSAMSARSMNKI
jgi:penicillin-binding protein 2